MSQSQQERDAEYAKAKEDEFLFGTGAVWKDEKTGDVKHIPIHELEFLINVPKHDKVYGRAPRPTDL